MKKWVYFVGRIIYFGLVFLLVSAAIIWWQNKNDQQELIDKREISLSDLWQNKGELNISSNLKIDGDLVVGGDIFYEGKIDEGDLEDLLAELDNEGESSDVTNNYYVSGLIDDGLFYVNDEAVRLVGLGTTKPTAKFQVNSTNSGTVGLAVMAEVGQTADLLNILQSGGQKVARFDYQGKLILDNNADHQIEIRPSGNTGYLSSSGGAIFIENSMNIGTGIGIYSNQGIGAEGNMINVKVDNEAYDQAAFYMNYDGTSNAVEIVANTDDSSSNALSITNYNQLDSALGVIGYETGRGTVKITHRKDGTDTNASGLSIDLQGTGTAAQGIYVDSTASGGTSGNLLRLRNETLDRFVVNSLGSLDLGRNGTNTYIKKLGNTVGDEFYVGTNGAFRVQRSVTDSEAFRTQIVGDVHGRWLGTADGKLKFGDGTNIQDVVIERTGVGEFQMDTDVVIISQAVNNDVLKVNASDGSRLMRLTETSGGAGWFEVDNASGSAVWLLRADGGNSYVNAGYFGIGSTAPGAALQIGNGTLDYANGAGDVYVQNDLEVDGTIYGNVVGTITATGYDPGGVLFADSGGTLAQDATNFYWDDTNDRLGIGVTAPGSKLHIYDATTAGSSGLRIDSLGSSGDATIILNGADDSWISLYQSDTLHGQVMFDRGDGTMYVGTKQAGDDLVLESEAGVDHFTLNSNGAFIQSTWAATASLFINKPSSTTGHYLLVDSTGSSRGDIFKIDRNGYIGIGTSSPEHRLEIRGSGYNARVLIDTDNLSSYPGLEFRHNGDDDIRALIRSDYVTGDKTNLSFWTSVTASGSVPKMMIDENGYVGIGVTDPSSLLDIGGGVIDYIDGTNDLLVAGDLEVDGTIYGNVVGSMTATGLNPGGILFADSSGTMAQDAERVFWSDVYNRLGIGTSTPTSKVEVRQDLASFDAVYLWNGSAFINNTTESNTFLGTAYAILGDTDDVFYIGSASNFSGVYFDIATAATASGISLTVQYSQGGSAWNTLSVTDGTILTTSLRQDGAITFTPPGDWATDTVNGSTNYWIRLSTSIDPATNPTAYLTTPNNNPVFNVYALDSNPALFVDNIGRVGIGTSSLSSGTGLTVAGTIDASVQFLGQSADSVTTPSFSWTGDNNVGMYRPGTDILGFTTNGIERFRINATGNALLTGNIDITGYMTAADLSVGALGVGTTVSNSSTLLASGGSSAFVSPGGAAIFSDSFNETVNTTMASHVPDTGTSWTMLIQNGTATLQATASTDTAEVPVTTADSGVLYTADTTYSSADYEVKVTANIIDTSDDVGIIAARVQDASNMYLFKFSGTAANNVLYKEVGGVWTSLGTAPSGVSAGSTVKLRVVGQNITVYRDHTLLISVTDSDISAAGKAGFGAGRITTATDDADTTWEFDNFTVTPYDGAIRAAVFADSCVGAGCTTTNSLVQVTQSNEYSTGPALGITSSALTNSGLQIQIADTTALTYALDVTSNGGSTQLLRLTGEGNLGLGVTNPSSVIDIQRLGTAKANMDMLELTNTVNAADMDGTATSILFNGYYYDASVPAQINAGRISVGATNDWTSTNTTQDAYMSFNLVRDGTVGEFMKLDGLGFLQINSDTAIAADEEFAGINFWSKDASVGADRLAGAIRMRSDPVGGWSTSDQYAHMTFYTKTNGSEPTEKMRLTSEGNLGIGTTAPGSGVSGNVKLHVFGTSGGASGRTTLAVENSAANGAAAIQLHNSDHDFLMLQASGPSWASERASISTVNLDMAFVTDGNMATGGSHSFGFAAGGYNIPNQVTYYPSGYGAAVEVTPYAVTDKGLVIKANASQTANLQEWQDSSGTVLGSFQADGDFLSQRGLFPNGVFTNDFSSYTGGRVDWNLPNIQGRVLLGDTGYYNFVNSSNADLIKFQNGASPTFQITTPNAAYVSQIIKAAASQTANLQEWQNSSGGVLASVGATGNGYFAGNVGIGTTSPSNLLTFGSSDSIISTDTIDSSDNKRLRISSAGGSPAYSRGAYMVVAGNEYSSDPGMVKIVAGNVSGSGIGLYTGNASLRMFVDESGNVGIGATEPREKLDVASGNIRLDLPYTIKWDTTSNRNEIGYDAASGMNSFAQGNMIFTFDSDNSSSDRVFAINSNSTSGRLLTILESGNVGIGVTAPEAKLDVGGNVYVKGTDPKIRLFGYDAGSDEEYINIGWNSTNSNYEIFTWENGSGTNYDLSLYTKGATGANIGQLYLDTSGNVGIGVTDPSTPLHVKAASGNIATFESDNSSGCTLSDGGIIACSSDINLKKNITDLGGSLDRVLALSPVEFNWKSDGDDEAKQAGFIAQEVESIFPDLVSEGVGGYKSVSMVGMIPYITRAVQEQDVKLNDQWLMINDKVDYFASVRNDNIVDGGIDWKFELEALKSRSDELTMNIDEIEMRLGDLEERIASLENSQGLLSKLTNFIDDVIFGAKVKFMGAVEFVADATFGGSLKVNADTAGEILVPANTKRFRVRFETAFSEIPIVYLTSEYDDYETVEVTQEYFEVVIDPSPGGTEIGSIRFKWLALISSDNNLDKLEIVESSETVQEVEVVESQLDNSAERNIERDAEATESGEVKAVFSDVEEGDESLPGN